MLVTLMTVLAIWTLISVVLALIAGHVITFHVRVAQLDVLSEPTRGYSRPGFGLLPIPQT